MELKLLRKVFTDRSTIGELFVDGAFQCFTLEDVAQAEVMEGDAAIPPGRYPVVIEYSPRFKRDLPFLQDVPNFESVPIYIGGTCNDTEGGILVGRTKSDNLVDDSRTAFKELLPKLQAARAAGQPISIDISNTPSA